MGAILNAAVGGAVQGGLGFLNNYLGQEREEAARRENYKYGEMAANNADARTRALYHDFYSPEAILRQYNKAGLSPSMMFGGTPGQGGMSGAQGTGAAGPGSTYMPISMLEGAQAALIAAQADNVKADTKLKEEQTNLTEVEKRLANVRRDVEHLQYSSLRNEYLINTTYFMNPETGEANESFFKMARKAKSWEEFYKDANSREYSGNREEVKELINTEQGVNILRQVYRAAKTMDEEIDILSLNKDILNKEKDIKEEDLKLAQWQVKVSEALEAAGFANMNAEAAIHTLKSSISTADLNDRQKEAWNRLISKMGNSTMADIAVIVLSILSSNTNIGFKVGGK